jgi:hypothetical protein
MAHNTETPFGLPAEPPARDTFDLRMTGTDGSHLTRPGSAETLCGYLVVGSAVVGQVTWNTSSCTTCKAKAHGIAAGRES